MFDFLCSRARGDAQPGVEGHVTRKEWVKTHTESRGQSQGGIDRATTINEWGSQVSTSVQDVLAQMASEGAPANGKNSDNDAYKRGAWPWLPRWIDAFQKVFASPVARMKGKFWAPSVPREDTATRDLRYGLVCYLPMGGIP